MKVIYTAPNRAHHYRYALAMRQAGVLHKFVSGFPRLSPRSALPGMGDSLVHVDSIQTLFFIANKYKMPVPVTAHLAYLGKIQQDKACLKYLNDADIFMFYNGSGLNTGTEAKKKGKIVIAEAVNSHVHYQEQLLKEEHELSGLPWRPFHQKEKKRRMEEYDLADYILLPSEFVKRSFIALGFPEEKLLKVPYGFSQFADNGTIQQEHQDFTILYVGSVSVRKGVKYLIEAFKQFKHPRKKLVIVGQRNNPDGLEGVTIPDHVTFTGVLKGKDLENAYKSADVFCLPSIEEGLALVLGEALSFGVPIIATENTGADDIITDGKEGFIVPIRNSESIAEKLTLLADDKELYTSIQHNAISKVAGLKGWDDTGRLLVKSLNEVYNAKQRSK